MRHYIYFTALTLITTTHLIAMNCFTTEQLSCNAPASPLQINDIINHIFQYDPQSPLGKCSRDLYKLKCNQIKYLKINTQTPKDNVLKLICDRKNIIDLNAAQYFNIATILIKALEANCCRALKKLNIEITSPNHTEVQKILNLCPLLTDINLSWCLNSAKGIVNALEAGYGHQLKKINLAHTRTTETEVKTILKNCLGLTELSLGWCESSAAGLAEVLFDELNHTCQLQKLDLEHTNATADDIERIVTECPSLTELNLFFCNDAAEGLINALQNDYGNQLQKLILNKTNTTAEQIRQILEECSQLTHLGLFDCPNIVAGLVEALLRVDDCQLQELDLQSTKATADQVQQILERCPKLKQLNLSWCPDVATGLVTALQNGYGSELKVLYLEFTKMKPLQKTTLLKLLPNCIIYF